MDAFIFSQRYNSPAAAVSRRANPILCVASGRAPPGTAPTHACDASAFHEGIARFRIAQDVMRRTLFFDNGPGRSGAQIRQQVFDALAAIPKESLELVAYFGHGTPNGLESAHIGLAHLGTFASLLLAKCRRRANIVFYACSTGVPGGFAQDLASRLTARDLWVFGHTHSGHYADLTTFHRFPGGVPWSGEGRVYGFFNRERDRQARAEEQAAQRPGPEFALYGH